MPAYDFIAKDHSGRNFRGTLSGPSEQSVYAKLQRLGYVVLTISKRADSEKTPFITSNITKDDVVIFSRLLSTVMDSGITVSEALSALENQESNFYLRKIISQVREDVEAGVALSDALARHPRVFSNLFVSMVRSGEIGGNITGVLERLSDYLERDQEVRRAVDETFFYPKLIFIVASVIICFLLYFIIPRFKMLFVKVGAEDLPWITRAVIFVSDILINHGIEILGGLVVLVILYIWSRNSPALRAAVDRFSMSLPYYGALSSRIAMSRMIRSSGSMLETGVPLLDTLETARGILDNTVINDDIDRVIENLELGGDMASPMRASRHFPPVVVYMVGAGEQSGALASMLNKCAEAIDKELKYSLGKLLRVLQVSLLLLVAGIVIFIAVAMYLPVIDILTSKLPA
mgnify:CR=1 FL=1